MHAFNKEQVVKADAKAENKNKKRRKILGDLKTNKQDKQKEPNDTLSGLC